MLCPNCKKPLKNELPSRTIEVNQSKPSETENKQIPSNKVPCKNCRIPILLATAERNNGLCIPCSRGERPSNYKELIEKHGLWFKRCDICEVNVGEPYSYTRRQCVSTSYTGLGVITEYRGYDFTHVSESIDAHDFGSEYKAKAWLRGRRLEGEVIELTDSGHWPCDD